MLPDPHALNLRHLQAVSAIVRHGTMNAAADAVSLSQPALTQGLAKLERLLGVPLFLRQASGMKPTASGALLADRVERAFGHLVRGARGPARGVGRPEQLITAAHLRAFVALADAGSFLGAAGATGLSQPAVHRSARELEQIVATPLIERYGRGVILTPAGRRMAREGRLATQEIAAAISEIAASAQLHRPLVIGAMPLCRARLLPAALATFLAHHPQASIRIVEGSWGELVEPLRDGLIDCMIGALRPEGLVRDLDQRPLFEDRLIVVAGPDHPLAGHDQPDLDALARHPWIVGPAASPLREQWQALFAGRAPPAAPIECGSVTTIREMLRHAPFLTLLSPDQVAFEIAAGVLVQIGVPLPQCVRTIGVSTRASWRPTRTQQAFLDQLAGTV